MRISQRFAHYEMMLRLGVSMLAAGFTVKGEDGDVGERGTQGQLPVAISNFSYLSQLTIGSETAH